MQRNRVYIYSIVGIVGDFRFASPVVITDKANGAVAVITSDLDGDGDEDVVSVSDRDNKLSLLIKMGDCLGRSLRENVELFSITENEATYLTESNNIIRGNFYI